MFLQDQLESVDYTTPMNPPLLQAATMLDLKSLLTDIRTAVLASPILTKRQKIVVDTPEHHWSLRADKTLLHDK